MEFNDFFVEFFTITQVIPLSKYLRTSGRTKKTPKIMNSKRAGELLIYSSKDSDMDTFFKRHGFKGAPQLNYTSIMVLRKGDNFLNWKKVFSFLEGKGTIQEITEKARVKLLPQEIGKLEVYIKEELKLNDKDFNSFMTKFTKVANDKDLMKALKKLSIEYKK